MALTKAAAIFGRVLRPECTTLYMHALPAMVLILAQQLGDSEFVEGGLRSDFGGPKDIGLALRVENLLSRIT